VPSGVGLAVRTLHGRVAASQTVNASTESLGPTCEQNRGRASDADTTSPTSVDWETAYSSGLDERESGCQLQINHQLDAPVQLIEQSSILGRQDLTEGWKIL